MAVSLNHVPNGASMKIRPGLVACRKIGTPHSRRLQVGAGASLHLSAPNDVNRARSAKLSADTLRRRRIGVEPQIGAAIEQTIEHDLHLELRDLHPQAQMCAESEAHVRTDRPIDIELVRMVEDILVTIRRTGGEGERRSGRNLDPADLDLHGALTLEELRRGFPTHSLVENLWNQGAVAAHA